MKKNILATIMLLLVTVPATASMDTPKKKEYHVIKLSLTQDTGWCVDTDAPAGEAVAIVVGSGKNKYVYGTIRIYDYERIGRGANHLCNSYFSYDSSWDQKFPITLVYDYGSSEANEVTLNGF